MWQTYPIGRRDRLVVLQPRNGRHRRAWDLQVDAYGISDSNVNDVATSTGTGNTAAASVHHEPLYMTLLYNVFHTYSWKAIEYFIIEYFIIIVVVVVIMITIHSTTNYYLPVLILYHHQKYWSLSGRRPRCSMPIEAAGPPLNPPMPVYTATKFILQNRTEALRRLKISAKAAQLA